MRLAPFAIAAVLVVALAGCAANDPLAEEFGDGSGQSYTSGDGANTEIPPAARTEPVEFGGTTDTGDSLSSEDLAGQVTVVNFWYALCPPCRSEAPDLKALSDEYDGVTFLGVNISDDANTAAAFAKNYGIAYPSILDVSTGAVQLAFAESGAVAPNAVPTTVVIDREGRVAARISGLLDKSILAAMIDTVLAEAP